MTHSVAKNIIPKLPAHGPSQRIGLLGGSFNPPHQAHKLVSLTAMKRLRLDAVWWLVTPGNPLKNNSGLPPLDERMEAAQRLSAHPRIKI
ncbi:MAG: nicotinic acid mononucleotide adenylyltransferase, partial [Beijerinckiaceae bacterium]